MPLELKVPSVGESIVEVQIGAWLKKVGDLVREGDSLVEIESDKATVELPSPAAGAVIEVLKKRGEMARVGETIGYFRTADEPESTKASAPPAAPAKPAEPQPKGSERPVAQLAASVEVATEHAAEPADKSRVEQPAPAGPEPAPPQKDAVANGAAPAPRPAAPAPVAELRPTAAPPVAAESVPAPSVSRAAQRAPTTHPTTRLPSPELRKLSNEPTVEEIAQRNFAPSGREEEIVPMSMLRKRVAERLVEAQQTAALLTTFNEIDMSAAQSLRKESRDAFQEKFGVKLGLMSFFVKAVVQALKQVPVVNAELRGTDIVYRNYFDIGVAVGGGKGLVVPVLRDAEKLGFAEIERAIADFGQRAASNHLKVEELQGGTFTISNGGVYGSLLSTPIVNPPQSGILGLHAIQDRPVAREGQVVIRPMMYVALTYDHRLVDGRDAVTFLKTVKENVEAPARLLLEL